MKSYQAILNEVAQYHPTLTQARDAIWPAAFALYGHDTKAQRIKATQGALAALHNHWESHSV